MIGGGLARRVCGAGGWRGGRGRGGGRMEGARGLRLEARTAAADYRATKVHHLHQGFSFFILSVFFVGFSLVP